MFSSNLQEDCGRRVYSGMARVPDVLSLGKTSSRELQLSFQCVLIPLMKRSLSCNQYGKRDTRPKTL